MYHYDFRPYVSVAERRRRAEREMAKLKKQGHPVSPVLVDGRAIACTFWGQAWCRNLERYSDFSNRLPRGRTYVRNGSVCDLQVAPGAVRALVSGSEIYRVTVEVAPLPKARWAAISADCAGSIDSLVELLQGRLSQGVMERICRQGTGLFPAPSEIGLACSCPDRASMCKHVAAVLYGIGARLDQRPELLFKLRKVDETDLIAKAGRGLPLSKSVPRADRLLAAEGLSELFGLEMAEGEPSPRPSGAKARTDREQVLRPPEGKTPKTEPPKARTKPQAPGRGLQAKPAKRRTKTAQPLTKGKARKRQAKAKAPKRRTKTEPKQRRAAIE